jgi:tRNA A-37 threonylcarbamoyl transferase component Bud32
MVDVLLRQFEDVVMYLREAQLPFDVLANSNLGAAYEEIKLLHGRLEHVQSMMLAATPTPAHPSPTPSPPQPHQTIARAASSDTGRTAAPTGSPTAAPGIGSYLRSVSSSQLAVFRASSPPPPPLLQQQQQQAASPTPGRPLSTVPFDAASASQLPQSAAHARMGRATLADFDVLRVVGTGTFGTVQLVKHRSSGASYAIKVLDKNRVIATRQLQHLRYERQILAGIAHPFVIAVHCSMQDATNVYLVMDYVPGGELFEYIRRAGRFVEHEARFFAAEIVEALTHLHAFSIMYRDLKPENVLLDTDGHIKLIDFGFAKVMPPTTRAYTMCGTPGECRATSAGCLLSPAFCLLRIYCARGHPVARPRRRRRLVVARHFGVRNVDWRAAVCAQRARQAVRDDCQRRRALPGRRVARRHVAHSRPAQNAAVRATRQHSARRRRHQEPRVLCRRRLEHRGTARPRAANSATADAVQV